ncbi:hypothetical protein CDL15_Pgr020826 [Punica granatum]|uniref:Gnk2-homologous domain-containing protein n=1 Tax=Punica granatum TaxID=22663 RepID=A0A218XX58_PUNGR|nr:hypothetical protein CDL15_Pgr020826 [Punica granatum]
MILGEPSTNLKYKFCSAQKNGLRGFDKDIVDAVLGEIAFLADERGYDLYISKGVPPDAPRVFFFGHGAWDGMLSHQECEDCLGEAHDQLNDFCASYTGGQIQLRGCRLRFEEYPFIE